MCLVIHSCISIGDSILQYITGVEGDKEKKYSPPVKDKTCTSLSLGSRGLSSPPKTCAWPFTTARTCDERRRTSVSRSLCHLAGMAVAMVVIVAFLCFAGKYLVGGIINLNRRVEVEAMRAWNIRMREIGIE